MCGMGTGEVFALCCAGHSEYSVGLGFAAGLGAEDGELDVAPPIEGRRKSPFEGEDCARLSDRVKNLLRSSVRVAGEAPLRCECEWECEEEWEWPWLEE